VVPTPHRNSVGFFALLGIVAATHPGKGGTRGVVLGLVITVPSLVLAYRGARSATVDADAAGLTYRALIRARSWRWTEVASMHAEDTPLGVRHYRRRVLWLTEESGNEVKLEELNARPQLSPNPIDELADALNALLRAARGDA
jgi:hypothetical protein